MFVLCLLSIATVVVNAGQFSSTNQNQSFHSEEKSLQTNLESPSFFHCSENVTEHTEQCECSFVEELGQDLVPPSSVVLEFSANVKFISPVFSLYTLNQLSLFDLFRPPQV